MAVVTTSRVLLRQNSKIKNVLRMYIFYQFSVCRTHSRFLSCCIIPYMSRFLKGVFSICKYFQRYSRLNIYLEARHKIKILEIIEVPYKNLQIHSLLYPCGGFNTRRFASMLCVGVWRGSGITVF